ncbi:FAD-dependent monooxygenase [Halomonas janggokensis]|uniref:FAD-dependent monooxygenase n=1 Tax=Vreelandella janggokensis TaxID=370767 RepID=A0ABT4IWE7_9GAMM|nr:FAD-dependent monooxygenase [Halomonas janggokensis]MCZ0927985.1 FAD-dependent monooxygenase [Halomonas janggokensis]MCZ0930557.1 FAD-dependent monooxygenase [Halomonas janggokensis]
MLETDVVIIGSGPAGSSAALMLSSYGIKNVIITKYRWLADSPRAHYVSQRTMEIVRDLGIESEVIAKASPKEIMGDVVFCTSLSGDEIGRLPYGMNNPRRATEYLEASPSEQCDLPQHLFEPILLSNGAARGSHARFDTEYLSHNQDLEGVTVKVLDRLTGTSYEIRCKYLIGADGAGSKVVRDLNLPMAGQMGKSGSMSIIFDADLTKYIAHRPGYLWWVVQPGANIGGIGLGLLRMVRPWNEWQIVWGYDIDQPAPELTVDQAIGVCRQLIGDPEIDIRIRSKSLWTVNEMYATQYAQGRVFCMGDAVHRHPPSNGLGSNTSIQDAYNLCWKLAFVLRGQADPKLLDTYSEERAPVGERIVKRANRSVRDFGPIFEALGLDGRYSAEEMQARIGSLMHADQAAADRRAMLRNAIEFKSYEFAALGVETNVRYKSTAIASVEQTQPLPDRDEDLHYFPSCAPGHKLPHGWVVRKGSKVSTLDLIGGGRFSLLCWLQGQLWVDIARRLSEDTNVVIEVIRIGPGQEIQDAYGDLARIWNCGEQACLLIRPDGYIAWEALDTTAAYDTLRQGLMRILSRA